MAKFFKVAGLSLWILTWSAYGVLLTKGHEPFTGMVVGTLASAFILFVLDSDDSPMMEWGVPKWVICVAVAFGWVAQVSVWSWIQLYRPEVAINVGIFIAFITSIAMFWWYVSPTPRRE